MMKILIVCGVYYPKISKNLINQAIKNLKKSKFKYKVLETPGIFEIPVCISRNIKKYDGFVALGCVIKGKTPHFDLICQSTFNAIMDISVRYKKPVGNGIITALNMLQAKERSKNNKGKGLEASKAVISILKNASKK